MKKRNLSVWVVLGALLIPVCSAQAFLLDEKNIATPDNKCSVHYLTTKNTQGWKIKTLSENCPNGFLQGYAEVTVLDAFSRPIEQLFGYFSQGYWTGQIQLKSVTLNRLSEEYGIQKATFHIGQDKTSDITYIGQMTSKRDESGLYGPFNVCEPFRILAVTPNTALFRNPHSTQMILDDVLKQGRRICPAEKRILFFVSVKDNPQQNDIFFYADINLDTGKTYIKRNQARAFQNNQHISGPDFGGMDAESLSDLQGVVSGISYQKGPLFKAKEAVEPAVTFSDIQELSAYPDEVVSSDVLPIQEATVSVQEADVPVGLSEEPVVVKDMSDLSVNYLGETVAMPPVQMSPVSTDKQDVSMEKKPALSDKSSGSVQSELKLDVLPHLKVAYDVKMQPVLGTITVHIEKLTEQGAMADWPQKMILKGTGLASGWGIVSGYFVFNQDKSQETIGLCQVTSFMPCFSQSCQDIQ